MDFPARPPRHEAFILRLWQEGRGREEDQPIWRFKDLEALVAFLEQWMGESEQ
jgi:hypothetical protein